MVVDGFIKMRTDNLLDDTPAGRDLQRFEAKGKSAQQLINETPPETATAQDYVNAVSRKKVLIPISKKAIAATTKMKSLSTQTKLPPKNSPFASFLKSIPKPGARKKKSLLGVRDQVKVLKLRNMLEKQKLNNIIEKYKLQAKVEQLRRKGKLPMIVNRPMLMPRRPFTIFENPTINSDIESAFNADVNTQENFFGNESFFGGERYFDEDYFGNEFDNDPNYHLQIKPQRGLSPLWW